MKKDLPNIFKGKVNRNINQKEAVISSNNQNIEEKEKEYTDVYKEIKEIFNSESFIYKADTLITFYSGEKIKKTIIGRNNNSLITMDDDLIDINSIEKIEMI